MERNPGTHYLLEYVVKFNITNDNYVDIISPMIECDEKGEPHNPSLIMRKPQSQLKRHSAVYLTCPLPEW